MRRHRDIAAAPYRSASVAWQVITQLVIDTFERSTAIARADVEKAMAVAAPIGRHLIAGGHLDRRPLTVIASPVYCTISTVSGSAALSLEENLSPVPGGTSATEFMIYVPASEALADAVKEMAALSPYLSSDLPPDDADSSGESIKSDASVSLVNLGALAQRKAQQR